MAKVELLMPGPCAGPMALNCLRPVCMKSACCKSLLERIWRFGELRAWVEDRLWEASATAAFDVATTAHTVHHPAMMLNPRTPHA